MSLPYHVLVVHAIVQLVKHSAGCTGINQVNDVGMMHSYLNKVSADPELPKSPGVEGQVIDRLGQACKEHGVTLPAQKLKQFAVDMARLPACMSGAFTAQTIAQAAKRAGQEPFSPLQIMKQCTTFNILEEEEQERLLRVVLPLAVKEVEAKGEVSYAFLHNLGVSGAEERLHLDKLQENRRGAMLLRHKSVMARRNAWEKEKERKQKEKEDKKEAKQRAKRIKKVEDEWKAVDKQRTVDAAARVRHAERVQELADLMVTGDAWEQWGMLPCLLEDRPQLNDDEAWAEAAVFSATAAKDLQAAKQMQASLAEAVRKGKGKGKGGGGEQGGKRRVRVQAGKKRKRELEVDETEEKEEGEHVNDELFVDEEHANKQEAKHTRKIRIVLSGFLLVRAVIHAP